MAGKRTNEEIFATKRNFVFDVERENRRRLSDDQRMRSMFEQSTGDVFSMIGPIEFVMEQRTDQTELRRSNGEQFVAIGSVVVNDHRPTRSK